MSDDPTLDRVAAVVRTIATMLPKRPGGIVDLADLRFVLEHGGFAAFGEGVADGPDRATKAAEAALVELRRHLVSMVRPKE